MAGIVDRAVLSYAQMPDSAKIAMLSEAISQLQSEMAVANSRIEEIDGDFPQQILMGGGDDSAAFEYRSFFRVVVNVTGTGFIVCVTPGSDSPDGETYCGAVKINGVRVNVPIVCQTYTGSGHVVAWLHSWLDSFGAHADIVFGSDKNTPPGNPNGGFAFGSQLLGEVTVVEQAGAFLLNDLKQHYLRGGEHTEILVGECDEYWHWISPPPSGT